MAPGKRVELPSGRNCFSGLLEYAQRRVGQQALLLQERLTLRALRIFGVLTPAGYDTMCG